MNNYQKIYSGKVRTIYKNIQNVLLDPHQPMQLSKIRLNGLILEYMWLHIFYFDRYYINNFSNF